MAPPPSAPPKLVSLMLLAFLTAITMNVKSVGATNWCVARSDAGYQQLLSALDYACGNGADCRPIQPGGICFMPNSIQNHASYAFDSYYRRKGGAPGSCYFGGTATIAVTNPSFGRCIYPSSLRTAGGAYTPITTTPMNNPNVASLGPNMNERSMDHHSKRAETVSYTT